MLGRTTFIGTSSTITSADATATVRVSLVVPVRRRFEPTSILHIPQRGMPTTTQTPSFHPQKPFPLDMHPPQTPTAHTLHHHTDTRRIGHHRLDPSNHSTFRLNLIPSKIPIWRDGLSTPEHTLLLFEQRIPFPHIPFTLSMIPQKRPHDTASDSLHLCQCLDGDSSFPYLFGPFTMQPIDEFLEFVHVCLFSEAGGTGVFTIPITVLFRSFLGG